jgi:hypothetical protein
MQTFKSYLPWWKSLQSRHRSLKDERKNEPKCEEIQRRKQRIGELLREL